MGNNDNFFDMCRESFQDVKDAWDDVVVAFKELGDIFKPEIKNKESTIYEEEITVDDILAEIKEIKKLWKKH